MNKTHLRRSLAALATAFVCVIAMGNPAAAVPVTYRAEITGGEVTVTKTGITPEVFNLNPTTPSCTVPSTLDVHFTSNTTSSNVTVTAFNSSHVVTFANGGTYLVVMTRSAFGNVAGHLNSDNNPHTITGLRVGIQITVYNTASCTPTGSPICTLGVQLAATTLTTTSVSTSTNFSLTGSSVGTIVALPTCSTGPSYLIGASVNTTAPITGHLSSTV